MLFDFVNMKYVRSSQASVSINYAHLLVWIIYVLDLVKHSFSL